MSLKKSAKGDKTKKVTAVKKTASKINERLIYCGPNIPGGALQSFSVFKGKLPPHVIELAKQCPAIKKLCVPVAEFSKTRLAINKRGTPQSKFYKEVVRFIRKGGENR